MTASTSIGLVAIGRNEGERLRACLTSVVQRVACVVYVDSGSTDGSVAMAEALGVHVVNLDMTRPFTAARARNEGFAALKQLLPDVKYVQFVDGDCLVVEGWIEAARGFLDQHEDFAVVCGRRRERYPERSIYNYLCDIEWDSPIGEAKYCGGDVLMRTAAFEQAGGYLPSLIAGEEPELCVRLRRTGWRIFRLDHEMTLHDAAMLRFGQWWKRSMRAGYAYGNGVYLHGRFPIGHFVSHLKRSLLWGAVFPFLVAIGAFFSNVALFFFLFYPLQAFRLAWQERKYGSKALLVGLFLVVGKFSEAIGILKFYLNLLLGFEGRLIEYK